MDKKPKEAPVIPIEQKTKRIRKIFLWIFRKQVADIIYNHSESIQVRHVIEIHKSAISNYIEFLEFTRSDINKYFTLGSGLSARKAMREMYDFCGLKLKTLKKLYNELKKLEDNDEATSENN